MAMQTIPFTRFRSDVFHLFDREWLVLAADKIAAAGLTFDPSIESNYPERDHHTIYYGEVLVVRGEARFASG
jgi:hypothetical protein